MPVQVVNIDLTAETAARPQPTLTDPLIVGRASAEPPAGYATPGLYTDPEQVATDFGEDSDVHVASQAIAAMGASEWRVVVFETLSVVDELIDGSDGAATDTGTVDNMPLSGETLPTISVDGTDKTVEAVTDDPPAPGDVPADTAWINMDTGDLATAEETSGADAGIQVTYDHVDYQFDVVEHLGLDLVAFADIRMTVAHIGDLDELVTWASGQDMGVVAAHMNGTNATDDEEAMDTAHEVGSYVSSGDLLTVAHKSSADVAAHVLGQLATNDPWFDPFYDADGYPFSTDYYERRLVGDPATADTFEGGNQASQSGPTNVVINKGVDVLSNSLTTAGNSSAYQYFDVGRTEAFAATVVETALENLRLNQDQVPFTDDGRVMISSKIREALAEYTGAPDDPFASVSVFVPAIEDLSDDDVANRVYSGITIEGVLSGNVHEFSLELTVSV